MDSSLIKGEPSIAFILVISLDMRKRGIEELLKEDIYIITKIILGKETLIILAILFPSHL